MGLNFRISCLEGLISIKFIMWLSCCQVNGQAARRSECTVVVLERNFKMAEKYFLAQLASFQDEYKIQSKLIEELQ